MDWPTFKIFLVIMALVELGVFAVIWHEKRKLARGRPDGPAWADLTVVCLRVPEGIDESVAAIVNGAMNGFAPDQFALFQPDTYLFFFRNDQQGAVRSARAMLMLEELKTRNGRLAKAAIGRASGQMMVNFKSNDIVGIPLGAPFVDAQKRAA